MKCTHEKQQSQCGLAMMHAYTTVTIIEYIDTHYVPENFVSPNFHEKGNFKYFTKHGNDPCGQER